MAVNQIVRYLLSDSMHISYSGYENIDNIRALWKELFLYCFSRLQNSGQTFFFFIFLDSFG